MKNRSYRVTVRQSENRDDGMFVAFAAEFPDIKEYGETEREALELIADAIYTSTVEFGSDPEAIYVRHYELTPRGAPGSFIVEGDESTFHLNAVHTIKAVHTI